MQKNIESSSSFESQISRSFTSSPLPTELNPLSIRVSPSPILNNTQQAECFTPIKNKDSSIISIDEQIENNSNGLLTYSTPIFYSQKQSAFANYDLLKRSTPYSSYSSLNFQPSRFITPETRKPRVNFHSIDDLIKSDCEVPQNDSGISSYIAQPSSAKSGESPIFTQVKKTESDEHENKENLEIKKSQSNDNCKKVRTTFTDQQKVALDTYFRKNPYPDPKETEDLSEELVLPENVIKVWFQNKRSRDKQRKFSNKSKNNNQIAAQSKLQESQNTQNFFSSPIVANLQLLSSRQNLYAAVAAAAAAVNASNTNNHFYGQYFN